ncbi:hypothetical protein CcaCcLH18_11323 [Colletotrichum camelliae]|nr:hypothetical protein CcaCcLH18_11323 [Colletotrichum camelliae]
MSELNSITSRDMEDWLNSKGELTEEQKRWQTLDAKKKQAAAEGGNANEYTNWKTGNNTNINANNNINKNINTINIDDDDDDDRRSVLSSRIMRSGLTNIGQLVRTAPGLQSAQDRRAVEAAMRDPRYEAAWKGTKTKTMPSARQPRGTLQPLSPVPFVSKPQPPQDHQHQQHHHHQNTPFPSLQAVDAELSRVLQTQKRHLLDAVDCNVRINELYWHRHAMMERDADSPENNTAKE